MFPKMVEIFKTPVAHGVAKIEHRVITPHESDFSRLRAAIGHSGDYCPAGTFINLFVNGALVLSDTENERNTNYEVVRRAKGNVLIAGLGIGMILHPILKKQKVLSVTVIEKCADVIALVGPTVKHKKMTIIEGDIYEWKPAKGTKYDCLYFDIWGDISIDCLKDMAALHQKFKSYKVNGGWMESWQRDYLKYSNRGGYRW